MTDERLRQIADALDDEHTGCVELQGFVNELLDEVRELQAALRTPSA